MFLLMVKRWIIIIVFHCIFYPLIITASYCQKIADCVISFNGKLQLGITSHTKMDELSEKFQTAFDPPPSFLENHIADIATKVRDFP